MKIVNHRPNVQIQKPLLLNDVSDEVMWWARDDHKNPRKELIKIFEKHAYCASHNDFFNTAVFSAISWERIENLKTVWDIPSEVNPGWLGECIVQGSTDILDFFIDQPSVKAGLSDKCELLVNLIVMQAELIGKNVHPKAKLPVGVVNKMVVSLTQLPGFVELLKAVVSERDVEDHIGFSGIREAILEYSTPKVNQKTKSTLRL